MLDPSLAAEDSPRSGTTFAEAWLRRFAASALATEAELTALDQLLGDGDFGVNLTTGLRGALRAIDAQESGGESGPFQAAASAFLDDVGGTSGPLFGLLLQELATAIAATGELNVSALATGLNGGLAAIQRVGDASPGDKTLVDALFPACAALTAWPSSGDPAAALRGAAQAAWQGVRDTARMSARRGRASYVGSRAEGVPDPGAVGVALFLSSAEDTVVDVAAQLRATGSDRPAAGG
ncbi:dihydroxyacetone kinase subunit DhaL [Streptomyces sp. NPDC006733]|uniref:dihydroxyacetone kinase subunit DhaL n=1 Tax=Streptomyces sp. NPDC006733 TaxID=3155460 RepID=UPI0033E6EA4A